MPVPWTFSSEQACLVCLVAGLSVKFLILPGSIVALLFGLQSALPVHTYLKIEGLSQLGLGSFLGGQILPTLRTWYLPWRAHRLRLELQPLAHLVCQGLQIYKVRESGDTQQWICCLGSFSAPVAYSLC